jgi:hypothetical protein
MRSRPRAIIVLALAMPLAASAEPGKHDGTWNVVLVCPAHNADDDDAKGYTHRFTAEVNEGRLRGTHGTEGQPGWHFLHGRIHPDGEAALRLDGIVNNPKYAINDAQRGKPYSYRVKAKFEEKSGRGERMTGRACELQFTRSS